MELWTIPPGLILIFGGAMLLFAPYFLRGALTVALPLMTLFYLWQMNPDSPLSASFLGYELIPVFTHSYSLIFATAFAIAALGGGIFSLHTRRKPTELACAYIYAGSAVGVAFSGDLISFFVYWELMAIASTALIWSHGTAGARASGMRYALMHFLSGILLMVGIIAQIAVTNTTILPSFELHMSEWIWTSSVFLDSEIYADYAHNLMVQSLGIWLIFLSFLINVAAPPFSAWLSDAYPESSPTGMVFLSAFTTKSAVFALLTMFSGVSILIYIGLFMIFYGIIYAILENDMRRILAFSIINQVGFMVVGIGIGTTLAMQGVAAHAFCHIIYKALLVMSAGSVLHMTGRRNCSELGGLFRSMRVTTACGIIGALAISAFPLTSGFVSKSLIAEASASSQLVWLWYALLAASAGVFLHAGIKFPWFVFFQKDSGLRPSDPPRNMQTAMVLLAALCILPAMWPQQLLYALLPGSVDYLANTVPHVVAQLQLLLFSGLAFFLCLPLLQRTSTLTLTFDWLYRLVLSRFLILLEKALDAGYTTIVCALQYVLRFLVARIAYLTGPGGIFAETRTLANTTLIIAILLTGYLLFYYRS